MGRTSGKRHGAGRQPRMRKGGAGSGSDGKERRRRKREEMRAEKKAAKRARKAVRQATDEPAAGKASGLKRSLSNAKARVKDAERTITRKDLAAFIEKRKRMLEQGVEVDSNSDISDVSDESDDNVDWDSDTGVDGGESAMKELQAKLRKRRGVAGTGGGSTAATRRALATASDVDSLIERELDETKRNAEQGARESMARRRQLRQKLQRQQLETAIQEAESYLVAWYPGKREYLTERERRRKQQKFDATRLRGAAKPAEEAYPHLYPEYHEAKEKAALEEEEREQSKGDNILQLHDRHWGNHAETRSLLVKKLHLARVVCEQGAQLKDNAMMRHFRYASETLENVDMMDSDHFIGPRLSWLQSASFIEQGELGKARQVLEKALQRKNDSTTSTSSSKNAAQAVSPADSDPFTAMLLWDTFMIEYIAFFILQEEASCEETVLAAGKTAVEANSSILFALLCSEHFEQVVDGDTVDQFVAQEQELTMARFEAARDPQHRYLQSPNWTPEETAMVYFVRTISWWRDLDEKVFDFLDGNYGDHLHNESEMAKRMDQMSADIAGEVRKHGSLRLYFLTVWRGQVNAESGEEMEEEDEQADRLNLSHGQSTR